MVLKSKLEHEVERINIYQDRFLVASTPQTLMLGDLDSCCLSEVAWEHLGTEKYHFDTPQVQQLAQRHPVLLHVLPPGLFWIVALPCTCHPSQPVWLSGTKITDPIRCKLSLMHLDDRPAGSEAVFLPGH